MTSNERRRFLAASPAAYDMAFTIEADRSLKADLRKASRVVGDAAVDADITMELMRCTSVMTLVHFHVRAQLGNASHRPGDSGCGMQPGVR